MKQSIDKLIREVRACLWPCGMVLATFCASLLYYTFLAS